MRRLSFLLLGVLIAWLGVRVVSGAELFAPYLLRDGLLLGGLGALIFALNAQGWEAPHPFRLLRGLPRSGQILLLTGLIVALSGGLGMALGLEGLLGLAAKMGWLLGIVLQISGAWWPGAAVEYAPPPVRWAKDADGRFVPRRAADGQETGSPLSPPALAGIMRRRAWWSWLLLLLALAALLRFWQLEQLPPGCIEAECAAALRLMAPAAAPAEPGNMLALQERLAQLLVRFSGSGLLSLRLSATVFGWLTLVALAAALRRLMAPASALFGVALLAASPWHLWAGRTSDAGMAAAFLTALTLWLGLEALARTHARWWILWGAAAGLLAAQTPALWPGATLWVLVTAALGLGQAVPQRTRVSTRTLWLWPPAGFLAALSVALPALPAAVSRTHLWTPPAGAGPADNSVTLFAALLRPDLSPAGPFLQAALLNGVVAALVLAGLGALLRHLRQPAAPFVVVGAGALLWAAAQADFTATSPATLLLAGLPFWIALAAVAVDRLLAALLAAWGPPLVRSARLLAAAAVLLLLVVGRGTVSLLWALDAGGSGVNTQIEANMARYIAGWYRDHPDDAATTFVLPATAIDHPSVRLSAGAALAGGHLQPLELAHTLPYTGPATGDVIYLQPLLDSQVLGLLRQLYPNGEAATELDAAGEQALFNRFIVRQADLQRAQTLQMAVTPGSGGAAGSAGEAAFGEPLAVSALDFAWSATPPRSLPFTAQWQGSLVVPESGSYRFVVENSGPESTFTLTLDDVLLLDSSLGMREQQQTLAQGIYRFQLEYHSGSRPGDLRVRWQRPDNPEETLGSPFLHSPTLADQGLFGEYYANDRFEGVPVTTHKDPIIGLAPNLPLPYSVRWHGLLAAPRAGEYVVGADAGGSVQVVVDGQTLADNRAEASVSGSESGAEASSYSESLMYLSAAWHPVEIRFATGSPTAGSTGATGLRLLWQPPGSDPSELSSRYLFPAYGPVGPLDVALPPAPQLVDPMLGDDSFALSRASEVWQPHLRVPPSNLPPLPLQKLWQAGGVCGDAPEAFAAPHGAAFSSQSDKLYVADTGNRRIKVYSVDGVLEDVISSELLQEPVDVAVAADGTVLVLDALAQQVYPLTAGNELTPLPLQTTFYRPRGLAADEWGSLLVADTGGGRVALMDAEGRLAGQFGGQGTLLGQGQPVDAIAGLNALWAISAEDGRLWNLTTDGSFTAVQPTGTVDGPHLAQMADGRLLATDPARSTFLLFSSAGQPLGQFGYAGELAMPTGIAATRIGSGDIIAVVDAQACALSVWQLAQ